MPLLLHPKHVLSPCGAADLRPSAALRDKTCIQAFVCPGGGSGKVSCTHFQETGQAACCGSSCFTYCASSRTTVSSPGPQRGEVFPGVFTSSDDHISYFTDNLHFYNLVFPVCFSGDTYCTTCVCVRLLEAEVRDRLAREFCIRSAESPVLRKETVRVPYSSTTVK